MPCSAVLSCAWSTLKLAMSDPKVDELRLPMAVMSRVMKSCLPDSAAISKDARTYIMRACIVFIFYILSQAEDYASSKKRKTVTVEDVMMSLKTSGFDHLLDHLNGAFEFYNTARANRTIKPKPKPQKHVQSVATD